MAIHVFQDYAVGLFFWLPTVLGMSSTLIYGYKNVVSKKELRTTSFITLGVFCLGLLVFAFEGIICIIMAAPIGVFFTWLGYLLGSRIAAGRVVGNSPLLILALFISIPVFMGFEHARTNDSIRSVKTSIEIDATPEKVWKNVVQFPQLTQPTEFIFRTGIAFPISAQIDGKGVGAIRRCNFSTGSFIEPITVWDEPHILQFRVEDQPEPMREISPYNIHPNHLHGYWVSKHGQFRLQKKSNGHTLLEGTTWYVNKIRPDFYWTIWSDYIVHSIHSRVLEHIKKESEKDS